jgi:hypothetical protein
MDEEPTFTSEFGEVGLNMKFYVCLRAFPKRKLLILKFKKI